jgi:ATP-dependent RNA helicase SUPV3L1/SUV3
MATFPRAGARSGADSRVKAVLGPTNTGKTHLAIERLCAHSSGAIGFPLRLLAREVYERVCAIKGENSVALITGEERIEPKGARWLLCTVEAMPLRGKSQPGGGLNYNDLAFVALDEAQLAADRERGHIFTDRLLNARGREETMLLGSATIKPLVKALVPEAEIVSRPRFSTLTHIGAKKLSRIPPRSAIVAFSAEQVYAIAEMLRRFRGGAAVVMGALSPQTRNAQVALFQSGEVDYLVATDAVGMGLNLDVTHVAFAGLSKFDGVRQRRLTTAEMAQIAGRAGRHQRDGTFGTLAGTGSHDAAFTDEEVYAIEQHRFSPLTRLFWRDAEPRRENLATLIADLERPPTSPELVLAPETIDLAVLKRLAEEPDIAATVRSPAAVARFWAACSLPDFRQQGAETHARFVARLWEDLRRGHLGGDYVASAIAALDNVSGDIDTLQGRIAATRSWAYIAQRPDWVLARDEMAARARAVEARLSDALHARLTERFVNRRTTVLMKKLGADAGLLPVELEGDNVLVDGELIGEIRGFRFHVDPAVGHADRKLLLAAAERHVPGLLTRRAQALAEEIAAGTLVPELGGGTITCDRTVVARLAKGRARLSPQIAADGALAAVATPARKALLATIEAWLAAQLQPLAPLRRIEDASLAEESGPGLRALLIRLVDSGGLSTRAGSGVDALDKEQRAMLARLGVRVGTLDVFLPAMLRPAALAAWNEVAALWSEKAQRPPTSPPGAMPPVVAAEGQPGRLGYRKVGKQWLRLDMAEKLLCEAHAIRIGAGRRPFELSPAKAISMGLSTASYARLLHLGGFHPLLPRTLPPGAFGPTAPLTWRWRALRRQSESRSFPVALRDSAFAALAELVR